MNNSFYLEFDKYNELGVFFNHAPLPTLLSNVFGQFDGSLFKRAIEDEWEFFQSAECKSIWRHEKQSSEWSKVIVRNTQLRDLLRHKLPFGVLLQLPHKNQDDTNDAPHLFLEFSRRLTRCGYHEWRVACDFSIRNANLSMYKSKLLGIKGFFADNQRFIYSQFQYHNFFPALGKIACAMMSEDDDVTSESKMEKWQDKVNNALESAFEKLSDDEKRQDALPPLFTGCTLRTKRNALSSHELTGGEKIYLVLTRTKNTDFTHNIAFQIGEGGPHVSLEDCLPGITGFNVDGEGFRYQKLQYHNFFDAIGNVGRAKQQDDEDSEIFTSKWQNRVNKTLEAEFEKLGDGEKRQDILPPLFTGCYLRPTRDVLPDQELIAGTKIYLRLTRVPTNGYTHDIALQIGNKTFSIQECLPVIYRVVEKRVLEDALEDLALKADKEEWRFKKNIFGGLLYYIESVFDRLCKDEAAMQDALECAESNRDDGKLDRELAHTRFFSSLGEHESEEKIFNTGLLSHGHYIYAYCYGKDSETGLFQHIDWISHSYDTEGNRELHVKLAELEREGYCNHGLPYPPNWVREHKRLLFDYRYGSINDDDIGFSYQHIHENLSKRIFDKDSEEYNPNRFSKKRELLQKRFNAAFPYEKSIYEEGANEECRRMRELFEERIKKAWRFTRKRLQQNFKIAVPTYYKGKIQLLVPLYLDEQDTNQPTVALVVALNAEEDGKCKQSPRGVKYHYYCPTCLSLAMAKNDARVITRIDGTWLAEPTIENAIRNAKKEIPCEQNHERAKLLKKVVESLETLKSFDDNGGNAPKRLCNDDMSSKHSATPEIKTLGAFSSIKEFLESDF